MHFVQSATSKKNSCVIWFLAFTSCNIPLEKLKVGAGGEKTLMRQFLDKYLNVEGKVPHIPDPVNLRGTYLPKVRDEGRTLPVTVMHSFL